ncbi:MAG: hypothetical protein ACQKBV_08650 [Puniceicoccales bacterium]
MKGNTVNNDLVPAARKWLKARGFDESALDDSKVSTLIAYAVHPDDFKDLPTVSFMGDVLSQAKGNLSGSDLVKMLPDQGLYCVQDFIRENPELAFGGWANGKPSIGFFAFIRKEYDKMSMVRRVLRQLNPEIEFNHEIARKAADLLRGIGEYADDENIRRESQRMRDADGKNKVDPEYSYAEIGGAKNAENGTLM